MSSRLVPHACLTLVILGFAGCVVTREEPGSAPGPAGHGVAERLTPKQVADSVEGTIDRSVDPCADFYAFACGTWLKTSAIPADRSRWGRGFAEIEARNQLVLRDILEKAAANPGQDALAEKAGTFYATCMDEEAIERSGLGQLQPLFQEVARVGDSTSLMQATGALQSIGTQALFRADARADFKNPDVAIAYYLQGGLGLPDRDYYLKDDERSATLKHEYEAHVGRTFGLLGEPPEVARRHAASVMAFETQLAKVSMPREETRNLDRIYNKIDLAGLKKTAPYLQWDAYLEAIGYPGTTAINVGMPGFFSGLSTAASKAKPEALQAYLRWHLVHDAAAALPRAFVEEDFAFFGKTLSGQKEIQPRWKRCVEATDRAMGEILGRLYVARAFGGDSKPIALEMILGIESALDRTLPNLAWMDDDTRGRAVEKLKQVTNKIGYPEVWRDYAALKVERGDFLANSMAAARFEFRRRQDKVGKPVDRKEWTMTPPTVNAYYNPTVNEMVFPAGIMQRPFFSRDFPRAMNYGAIGMAMGHELTHGFDDQGRKFDGTGLMREWWKPEVVSRFVSRAQCVETLYSTFEIEPGVHVNGKLTLGENIADLGGIKEAYSAYKAWEAESGGEVPEVPGFSNDQLFFLGYAQSWCELITPERARVLVSVDPHSPARFRVQGALQNFPVFAEVFACKPGAAMNPENRCEVW